jgi:hypothetical protein
MAMSRMARTRLVAILVAYALVLQPVVAAALLLQVSGDRLVVCSAGDNESGLPVGHERDACCAAACCGSSLGLAPRGGFVVLASRGQPVMAAPAELWRIDQEREERARAPPDGAVIAMF